MGEVYFFWKPGVCINITSGMDDENPEYNTDTQHKTQIFLSNTVINTDILILHRHKPRHKRNDKLIIKKVYRDRTSMCTPFFLEVGFYDNT